MKIKTIAGFVFLCAAVSAFAVAEHPNVVIIYADDLGYGDVGCYNPESKIPTPNIDKLAEDGMRFTDAHAPDSICSPSRYGILTGRYSWRVPGWQSGNPAPGDQPLADSRRLTMPRMFKNEGYDTAVFGKWGLGADWASAAKDGRKGFDVSAAAIDYSKPIWSGKPFGFTHEEVHLWYGTKYHKTHYPCHDVPGTQEKTDGGRWYFKNGMSRDGDPDFASFDMEEAQMHYIQRTVEYIDAKGGTKKEHDFNVQEDAPFFIYYAPHIPHYPHVPAPQFQGKSGVGLYGDFIYELDWAVGQIVQALERNGLSENTLVVFASDNGPEGQTYGYAKQYDHYSMGKLRGLKREVVEGGHRTPFIISWPGTVKSGAVSERLVSQTDIFATMAQQLNVSLPDDAAEDSYSFLDELVDTEASMPKRDLAIHHSMGNDYALRTGDWVYVDAPRGSNRAPTGWDEEHGVVPHSEPFELFNLKDDPYQKINLYAEYPEKAAEMKRLLESLKESGRTR